MKSIKFLFMVAFMAMSIPFVTAQGLSKINEASFFKTKFNKEKVWDAQYSPITPIEKQSCSITGLKGALDANKVAIDWGNGRYLMFVAEADNANTANSLVDDVNNATTKYNVSLKLFESNGTLVKVISKWGNIIGIGSKSFTYEAEGKSKIFFTIFDKKSTDIVKESTINLAKAIKLSQLPFVQTKMLTGKVKFYNESNGFGFIKESISRSEYFVHVSGLIDEVRAGDDVSFDLVEGKKGADAVNVKLL